MTDDLIPAEVLAQKLNVLVATLGKWRRTGRGPDTWIYTSKNRVAYPKESVDRYLSSLPVHRP